MSAIVPSHASLCLVTANSPQLNPSNCRGLKPVEFEGFRNRAGLNIHMSLVQGDRLKRLNQIAICQMQTLTAHAAARQLEAPKGAAK